MTDKEKQIFDKYGNYNFPTDIKQESPNTATTQIEEMAKVIHYDYWGTCGKDSCSDCPLNLNGLCKDKEIADRLYEQGYRKIPEGSVIVSKQIWEEHIEKREKANKIFEERVRQETAREFAKGICKMLWHRCKDENGKTFDYGDLTSIDVYEIAKQFGVEVEE